MIRRSVLSLAIFFAASCAGCCSSRRSPTPAQANVWVAKWVEQGLAGDDAKDWLMREGFILASRMGDANPSSMVLEKETKSCFVGYGAQSYYTRIELFIDEAGRIFSGFSIERTGLELI